MGQRETVPPSGPGALFWGFLEVGLLGFGGVLPWARRLVVEKRRWLSASEFTDLLALCQFLPGPNICNMTVALGRRFHGAAGSVAALGGLMAAPLMIAVGLGWAYGRYGELASIAHGLTGLAAAASGLILATAVKVGMPLRGVWLGLALATGAFVAIAMLRMPLLPTMLVFASISVWLHWQRVEAGV